MVTGDEVSIFYDPMISKLIAHGEDRPAALRRLREALKAYEIVGLSNNIEFLRKCVCHPDFVKGGVTTNFLNVRNNGLNHFETHALLRVINCTD